MRASSATSRVRCVIALRSNDVGASQSEHSPLPSNSVDTRLEELVRPGLEGGGEDEPWQEKTLQTPAAQPTPEEWGIWRQSIPSPIDVQPPHDSIEYLMSRLVDASVMLDSRERKDSPLVSACATQSRDVRALEVGEASALREGVRRRANNGASDLLPAVRVSENSSRREEDEPRAESDALGELSTLGVRGLGGGEGTGVVDDGEGLGAVGRHALGVDTLRHGAGRGRAHVSDRSTVVEVLGDGLTRVESGVVDGSLRKNQLVLAEDTRKD